MTHPLPEGIIQKEANKFIGECHNDFDIVKKKVSETPQIVNVYNPNVHETALGAAGHMGRRDIAEFLLDNGAELELATAAMLAMRDKVAEWLAQDPGLAASGGAHNIPVAFHAAVSGDTEVMQLLWDAGAEEQVKGALMGAVSRGHLDMTRWLIEHDADQNVKDFRGQSLTEVAEQNGFSEILALLDQ